MSRWWSVVGVLVLSGSALAQPRWETNKGDCERIFREWRTESVDRLRDCVMKWEMYRDVTKVDADQRSVAQEAFDKLYQEGTERDAVMSLSALKRLGLRPTRLRKEAAAVPVAPPPREAAPTVVEAPVDEGPAERAPTAAASRAPNRREAQQHFETARRMLAGGQVPEALSEFLIAADSDPTYAAPLYMAAVCYVKLGKLDVAVDYLRNMKSMNSDQARQLVRRAASDPQFNALRPYAGFKDVTGTAVIQVLNGGGDKGKEKVAEYKKRLGEIGMPVTAVGTDRNSRHNIWLYTKPGFEDQGEEIRRQLRLGMVHKRPIDWPTEYDIILIHGEAPAEAFVDDEAEKGGQALAEKKKKEEEAKRKEEEAANKEKDAMRKKLQMLKMLEEMEAPEAPQAPTDPTQVPMDAPKAPSLP